MVNVRYWHKADILSCIANVRFQGLSGHCSDTAFLIVGAGLPGLIAGGVAAYAWYRSRKKR